MAVQMAGPYSMAVYNAANIMDQGGSGTPYSGGIIGAAQNLLNDQPGGQTEGGSTTYTPPPVDPYAQWGGQASYNNLISGYNTQYDNLNNDINTATSGAQTRFGNSVIDTLNGLRQGQKAIDLKATQNEAAKQQGAAGVLGMVGRGIKSGGVMLANKNAGSSSAAGALAAAYGDQGRRQMSQIGNQYAQNQSGIALDQENLGLTTEKAKRDFSMGLTDSINTIVNDARNRLGALHAEMAGKSLPERFALQQEIDRVKNDVTSKLQQYDSQLQSGIGGIRPQDQLTNQAAARSQIQAGVAPENSFQYDTQAPGQFQDSGQFASSLPLFTLGRRRVA